MRVLLPALLPALILALLLVPPAIVQAATAFSAFTVQVVVIGPCRIDAGRILPQLAKATEPRVCARIGASPVVTLDRNGRKILVEF